MRARKSALLLSVLLLFFVFLFIPLGAHAASLYELSPDVNPAAGHASTVACASMGATWSNATSTCTLSTSLTLGSADRIDVLNVNGVAATLLINSGATVTNSGTIATPGNIINSGTITNNANAYLFSAGGSFNNKGTINNLKGGAFQDDNAGGQGTLTNSGTINNYGWLQLYSGTTVTFSGPSSFSGTFTNTGTLNMNSGSTLTVGYNGIPTVLEIKSGTLSMPSGVTLYVYDSGTVKVDPTANIAISGFLTAQAGPDSAKHPGGMVANAGTITVSSGGVLTNGANATIPVTNGSPLGATITNSGTLTNSAGATVNNMFGGNVLNSGIVNNAGTMTSNGVVTNQPLGVVNNNAGGTFSLTGVGALNNNATGTINNSGTVVTKSGGATITSAGTFNDNSGGNVTLNDVLTSTGTFLNNFHSALSIGPSANFYNNNGGTLTNQGGTVTNSGSLWNSKGATINNNGVGTITNTDYIINTGTINDNVGGSTITSSGTILNKPGGTFNIFGSSVLTNSGTFNNTGGAVNNNQNANFYNKAGAVLTNAGSITNSGALWNSPGATVANLAGGTFSNVDAIINHGKVVNSNAFSNSGTINNCGGTVIATPAITGNPVKDICPVTDTKTAPVTSGAFIAQTFTDTGVTVAVSGTTGQSADIFTAKYSSQPPDTGTATLSPPGGSGGSLQFVDVAISGVTGGTAQVCVASSSVDSSSSIAYYSSGNWSLATSVTATAGAKVCGSIPVAALTATPLVVGDPRASTTTSSTVPEFPTAALVPVMLACLVLLSLLTRKSRAPTQTEAFQPSVHRIPS